MPSTRTNYRAERLIFALGAGLVLLYVLAAGGNFPLDDSWIHQTYGRNLAQHGEWAYVPGTASAASTAPFYTVLLAIGYWAGVPFRLWTHGLGAVCLGLLGWVAMRLAGRLAPQMPRARWLAGIFLVMAWHLIWAAASGMETIIMALWSLVLPWLAWQELDENATSQSVHVLRRGAVFGAFSGFAWLTRPEGILLAGLCGLALLVVRPAGWRRFWIYAVAAGAGFLLVVAPYVLYNFSVTGGLLPATSAAKQADLAPLIQTRSLPQRLLDMTYPLLAGAQVGLLPGVAYLVAQALRKLRQEPQRVFWLLPVIWSLALILLYAWRLPAPFQHGRYVMPALPGVLLAGLVGTLMLAQHLERRLWGRVIGRALFYTALVLLLTFAFGLGLRAYVTDVAIINQEMVAPAQWIAQNLPPDELLVVHDIGAVGYFANRPVLDLAGLVSPEVIPIMYAEESLWALIRQRNGRYLMALPDQVPGQSLPDERLCPRYQSPGDVSPLKMVVYEIDFSGICTP